MSISYDELGRLKKPGLCVKGGNGKRMERNKVGKEEEGRVRGRNKSCVKLSLLLPMLMKGLLFGGR